MDIRDKLVACPTNVKFQAPFPHNQKRQINLLNLSNKNLLYSVKVDHEALFQVIPSKGELAAFDTNELTIFMKPATGESPGSVLKVSYKASPERNSSEAANHSDQSDRTVDDPMEDLADVWNDACTTQVRISLENCVENEQEMCRMFELSGSPKNMTKIVEEQYKPICTNCCLKRTNPLVLEDKNSWKRLLFWPGCIAVLSVTVFFGCEIFGLHIFDLSAERIF